MTTTIENPNKINSGKTMAGIIILVIGSILLIDQLNIFFIPEWLYSWPMWIIAYGLYMGGKYNFRKPVWVVMITIGTCFLITENVYDADRFVWPAAIMALGVWIVMKNQKHAHPEYQEDTFKKI